MSVKLIWITPDAEKHIAFAARVSNPQNQDNPNYEKLLEYCVRNNHVSIFEMASMCVEVKCSRTISRQILRHRSFSFQEFSGRYATMPEEPIYTTARLQDTKNRQNSIDTADSALLSDFDDAQEHVWDVCWGEYTNALRRGVAKEVARNLLPEGMTPSTFYMSGTARSWLHFIDVRLFGPGVQKEARDVAREVFEIFKEHFPTVCKAKGWI